MAKAPRTDNDCRFVARVDFNDAPLSASAQINMMVGDLVRLTDPDPTVGDAVGRVYEIVPGWSGKMFAHFKIERWLPDA